MYGKDITGLILGKLTVIKKLPLAVAGSQKRSTYLCRCECGTERKIPRYSLTRSTSPSRSCGCTTTSHTDPKEPRLSSARDIFRITYSDGDLTFEEFLTLSQQSCHYCGKKHANSYNKFKNTDNCSDFSIKHGKFTYNGLDRKDNSRPHDKSNLVTCCSTCNWHKGKMSLREFKAWIRKVYRHIEKTKVFKDPYC